MNDAIVNEIVSLRENSDTAYVASVSEEGFPQMKAMFVLERRNMRVHLFSTNTSSKRVGQFRKNPKASVYYCDEELRKAVLFTGKMEICSDRDAKDLLWRDGFECYYPEGVKDEDYCVLKFTAETVNFYHGARNMTFSVKELENNG